MALTDQAIEKIRSMILRGELKPGDRLPPEAELSERLGLSRNSLREAVKALELINVLDIRRGDGTYVTTLKPNQLLDVLSFVIDFHDGGDLLDSIATRRIIESAAVELATFRINQETLDALAEDLRSVPRDADIERLVQHDVYFHQTIMALSGNNYLASLANALASSLVRVRTWRGLTENGSVARTLLEHEAILNALAARDGQLAGALMAAHISGVERWVRTKLV